MECTKDRVARVIPSTLLFSLGMAYDLFNPNGNPAGTPLHKHEHPLEWGEWFR